MRASVVDCGMSEQLISREGERASGEHIDAFPAKVVPRTPFQAALLKLTGYQPTDGKDGKRDGRRAALLAAMEYRASWPALRSWLRGEKPAPLWAVELATTKLDAYSQAAALVRREHKPGRGQGWRRAR